MQVEQAQQVQTTKVIGGDVPNQESAIGAGTDYRWRWWKVLAGLVACMAAFFALTAAGFSLYRSTYWTEDELTSTFVQKPMTEVTKKFGPPDATEADAAPIPSGGRAERLLYRTAVVVKDKPTGTLVTFHGEDGIVTRVSVR